MEEVSSLLRPRVLGLRVGRLWAVATMAGFGGVRTRCLCVGCVVNRGSYLLSSGGSMPFGLITYPHLGVLLGSSAQLP